jgi:hypothetical protein
VAVSRKAGRERMMNNLYRFTGFLRAFHLVERDAHSILGHDEVRYVMEVHPRARA